MQKGQKQEFWIRLKAFVKEGSGHHGAQGGSTHSKQEVQETFGITMFCTARQGDTCTSVGHPGVGKARVHHVEPAAPPTAPPTTPSRTPSYLASETCDHQPHLAQDVLAVRAPEVLYPCTVPASVPAVISPRLQLMSTTTAIPSFYYELCWEGFIDPPSGRTICTFTFVPSGAF